MGRDKFFALLGAQALLVRPKKSFSRTTYALHRFHKYENLVKDLKVSRPHQVYVADITYLRTRTAFVYLSLLTDACSRKIVGWHVAQSLSIEGSLAALQMAAKQAGGRRGIIHHSDRGIQYCSQGYVQLAVGRCQMAMSMTEENHCYENALAERGNGILKDEFLLDVTFEDLRAAQQAVAQAVKTYNTLRPHWSLELQTPQQVHGMAA